MHKLKLEIIENKHHDKELKNFWLDRWNAAMKRMTGEEIANQLFHEQSYFYVLKHDGMIIGVMSSTWQNTNDDGLVNDHYYSAHPQTIELLKKNNIKKFHKMGMIIANLRSIPKGLKFTPIIIGCGLKFVFDKLQECEAVVSFPRTDTTVFRSCLEWGAQSLKSDIMLYGCPVQLIYLNKKSFTPHANEEIKRTVQELFLQATYKIHEPV